jgi:hypothetical protein
MLRQQEWRGDIDADGLLPFDGRDFSQRLHDCDAGVVHEQIEWTLSNLSDEIGNAR